MRVKLFSLLLIANAGLFAAGIWRSVQQSKPAFHTIGELTGISGAIGEIWVWGLACVAIAGLLAWTTGTKRNANRYEQSSHDE